MNTEFFENKIIIKNAAGFDLKKTFECGQCFRFDSVGDAFEGVAYGKLLTLKNIGGDIEITGITKKEFETSFIRFFDLERDYLEIDTALASDPVLKTIIPFSTGIRILRQEPFEALTSFIISASNNIPRIKKIIGLLCKNFGEKHTSGGRVYYSFPDAETLAGHSLSDFAVIRAGFRDKYILDCAKKVSSGEIDLDGVAKMPYCDAAHELMKIKGVGQKVADCALLFGFGFLDSFPKDVWIKRVLKNYYNTEDSSALDFHGYGGIAQQYLFYYARETALRDNA